MELSAPDAAAAEAGVPLAEHLGGNEAVAELLLRRGVDSPEASDRFFAPSIADLHDPFLMPDMDKAVNRLNKAMGAKEKILVYGDYDVDGHHGGGLGVQVSAKLLFQHRVLHPHPV